MAAPSVLADATPNDAIAKLKADLIGSAESYIRTARVWQDKNGGVLPSNMQVAGKQALTVPTLEGMRQAARCLREARSIADSAEPRPPAPGRMREGVRVGGETRGGLAGPLIKAHRGAGWIPSESSAPEPPEPEPDDASPTAYMAAQVERMQGEPNGGVA